MKERTHFDDAFQLTVRGETEPVTAPIWVSNDGDLTGARLATPTSPFLSADGDVVSCQLFVGRELPGSRGLQCKLVRGM